MVPRFAVVFLSLIVSIATVNPRQSFAVTDAALDAVLAKADLDIQFSEETSAYVALVRNLTRGNFNSGVIIYDPVSPVVVTNCHLLVSTSDLVYIYMEGSDKKLIGFPTRYRHGDPGRDLAAFELINGFSSEQRKALARVGFQVTKTDDLLSPKSNMSVDINQFAESSDLARGREVFFLGFPLEQGINKEMHEIPIAGVSLMQEEWVSKSPIVRFGRIASTIQNGEFMIDAMINHGNSGSPVFVAVREPRSNGTSITVKFAGIIKGFLSDNITYKSDAGHALSLPHNSGLGMVITASEIRSLLK